MLKISIGLLEEHIRDLCYMTIYTPVSCAYGRQNSDERYSIQISSILLSSDVILGAVTASKYLPPLLRCSVVFVVCQLLPCHDSAPIWKCHSVATTVQFVRHLAEIYPAWVRNQSVWSSPSLTLNSDMASLIAVWTSSSDSSRRFPIFAKLSVV